MYSYYLENYREACDSAGEWFADFAAGVLYWQPRQAGEDPRHLVFEVGDRIQHAGFMGLQAILCYHKHLHTPPPLLLRAHAIVPCPHRLAVLLQAPVVVGDLLVLNGTIDVHVEDIAIELADWDISPTNTSSGGVQAASFLNQAAVHIVRSSGCTFTNVTVRSVGTYGMWVDNGATGTVIDRCLVADVGAGGIRIGRGAPLPEPVSYTDASWDTIVRNSTVVWGSHVYHEGNGILLQHSSHNIISDNEVAYFNHVCRVYRPDCCSILAMHHETTAIADSACIGRSLPLVILCCLALNFQVLLSFVCWSSIAALCTSFNGFACT